MDIVQSVWLVTFHMKWRHMNEYASCVIVMCVCGKVLSAAHITMEIGFSSDLKKGLMDCCCCWWWCFWCGQHFYVHSVCCVVLLHLIPLVSHEQTCHSMHPFWCYFTSSCLDALVLSPTSQTNFQKDQCLTGFLPINSLFHNRIFSCSFENQRKMNSKILNFLPFCFGQFDRERVIHSER